MDVNVSQKDPGLGKPLDLLRNPSVPLVIDITSRTEDAELSHGLALPAGRWQWVLGVGACGQ